MFVTYLLGIISHYRNIFINSNLMKYLVVFIIIRGLVTICQSMNINNILILYRYYSYTRIINRIRDTLRVLDELLCNNSDQEIRKYHDIIS